MSAKERRTGGFTMMEMLIVVGIVAILLAVAFISVMNYRRSMKQLELDRTAQEIFVAAQNHLTMAKSQGTLDTRDASNPNVVGKSFTRETKDGDENKTTAYHAFFYDPTTGTGTTPGTILYDMLPNFSLDDTVRLGGSYVIEYDLASATVTNVFYSDQDKSLSDVQFTSADYAALFGTEGSDSAGYWGTDEENKGAPQRRLDGFGGPSKIIGWYGGDAAKSLTRTKLYPARVEIINEECLYVKVSYSATALNKMTEDSGGDAWLKLTIAGKTSKKERMINGAVNALGESLSSFLTSSTLEGSGTSVRRYKLYLLDDITQNGKHFKDLWCGDVLGDKKLIPGEDITVTATTDTQYTFANITTASDDANSLFNKMTDDSDAGFSTQKKIANIANIRHLENLDPAISGYDLDALGEAGATKALQTADLSWSGDGSKTSTAFLDRIEANKARGLSTASKDVMVYYADGKTSATQAGTYAPVNPTYELAYDGDEHQVSTVRVSNAAEAGLFGTLSNGSVQDLTLVDSDVRTTQGNAGTLAGTLNGTKVTNVIARNTAGDSEASLEVRASGNAGGLVGSASGATITNCAAAVYVRSTGGAAGGLVGATSGATTVDRSYAGGHTVDGAYLDNKTDAKAGRYNVMASQEAGGLVGKATGTTTIASSYATTSASGATVGGLVGDITGGVVRSCYATGLVEHTENNTAGAFVGKQSGTSFVTGDGQPANQYIALINGSEVAASAAGAIPEVSTADANIQSYQQFSAGKGKASAYDATLTKNYNGSYPFRTVVEQADPNVSTDNAAKATHYGDWPSPEIFIVNRPS